MIIVDSSDAPDEVRFTVAHEAAHFLLDYEQPRARAVAALGAGALAARSTATGRPPSRSGWTPCSPG
ncbi:MAG: ImmA/IrrE family metallo-endopeptidase [Dehalococcoidia bacterium]